MLLSGRISALKMYASWKAFIFISLWKPLNASWKILEHMSPMAAIVAPHDQALAMSTTSRHG